MAVGGVAYGAETVIAPWYVPAARLVELTLTCNDAGMEPLEGVTLSHVALEDAVNDTPVIDEERLIVCGGGAVPPDVAARLRFIAEVLNDTVDVARTSRIR